MTNPFETENEPSFVGYIKSQVKDIKVGQALKLDTRNNNTQKVHRAVQCAGEKFSIRLSCRKDVNGEFWVKRIE